MSSNKKHAPLTRMKKETIALLSIGIFLEYFGLMIYVHIAALLNELFFPETDPYIGIIYSTDILYFTLLLSPFGALVFGWIGDHIGRKAVITITTLTTSIACITIAVLPTYAQIGITATYMIIICYAIQSLSLSPQLIGAQLCLTEITTPPIRYPVVALLSICTTLGGVCALAISSFIVASYSSWRIVFLFGTILTFIGAIARATLQETPDFLRALRQKYSKEEKPHTRNNDIKSAIVTFFIYCAWPVCFYFVYIYCDNILKHNFGLNSQQIIQYNFLVSIIELIGVIIITFLSYKISPLKIVKTKLLLFTITIIFTPFLIEQIHSYYTIFFIQCCILLFSCTFVPALPIIYKNISVLRRFTYVSFIYAASRVIMYPITAFGIGYLTKYLGYWGLLILMIPIIIAYTYGIVHFDKLEKTNK